MRWARKLVDQLFSASTRPLTNMKSLVIATRAPAVTACLAVALAGCEARFAADTEGFDTAALRTLTASIHAGEYPGMHALLIERNGRTVYEEYFTAEDTRRGRGPLGVISFDSTMRHDVRSITKSVVSALVGIAIDSGVLTSIDQPLVELFPDYAEQFTGDKRLITIRHALTMSAGLEWREELLGDNPRNDEVLMNRSADPILAVLSHALVATPGTQFSYNGGLTQLLAAAVQRSVGRPLKDYAMTVLFEPLGITDVEWVDDGQEVPSAASGLRLRARDLATFGALYAAGGEWNGRQIISAAWIEESTRWQRALPGESASDWENGYGFQWWIDRWQSPRGPLTIISARGNGSQRIYIVPSLQLVATMLAGNYNTVQELQDVADHIFETRILPAIRQ